MANKKIAFMGSIYRGHVEPTKYLVQELLNQEYDVTYYSLEKYRSLFNITGMNFVAYPEAHSFKHLITQKLCVDSINDRIFTLLNNAVFASFDLVKWGKDELENAAPDLVIYDNTSLWGHILARMMNIASVCSSGVMLINEDSINSSGEGKIYINLPINVSTPLQYLSSVYPNDVSNVLDFMSCKYSSSIITYTSPYFQRHSSDFSQDKYLFYPDRCDNTNIVAKDNPTSISLLNINPLSNMMKSPHIFVSLGTVYNDNLEFFQDIVNSFIGSPYQITISTGARNQVFEQLSSMNSLRNIKIVDFINQVEMLKETDVFITHGGLNSVSEAVCNLVPMLVVPQVGDQIAIAQQLEDLNASKVLKYSANFSEEIHPALNDIFSNWNIFQSNLIEIKKSFIDITLTNHTISALVGLMSHNLSLVEEL